MREKLEMALVLVPPRLELRCMVGGGAALTGEAHVADPGIDVDDRLGAVEATRSDWVAGMQIESGWMVRPSCRAKWGESAKEGRCGRTCSRESLEKLVADGAADAEVALDVATGADVVRMSSGIGASATVPPADAADADADVIGMLSASWFGGFRPRGGRTRLGSHSGLGWT